MYLCIATLLSVLLNSVFSSRESVLVDLGLDLLGRVGQVDGAGGVTGRHLGLRALHCREERAVKESRFEVAKSWSHIPGHPEVRVLVDSTGDEAGHGLLVAKDEREGGGETRSRLDRREADLSNWTAVVKSENPLHLVVSHALLDLDNVLVEGRALTHEGEVGENESFLDVESKCNNILDILPGQAHRLLLLQVLPQELLIVGHLDDQGHIKGLLQPFSEEEGNEVAKVHRITAGTSSSVKEELFSLFNLVKDKPKVSM